MKKVIGLFLFFIFLFNTVGYYIVFKVIQTEAKREIRSQILSGLDSDKLINITINKNDIGEIKWEESGREMLYKNEWYDVVRSTETAATITYYCINDTKEKILFSNLDEHVNIHVAMGKPDKNPASKKLLDHIIKLYFPNEQLLPFHTDQIFSMFFLKQVHYSSTFIEANSPPPESV